MATLRTLALCISLLAATFMIVDRCPAEEDPYALANVTVGVADFSGADKQIGRFVADTLLTDLAQSTRLHLVERSEIGRALTELKLQSTGLTEPQQVRKVGKIIGADRLIVGSYLLRDDQLLINARLLDVHTGRVVPGGAANVTGARDAMLPLVHRLAHLFHKRVVGVDFSLENEDGSTTAGEAPDRSAPDPAPQDDSPAPVDPDASGLHFGPADEPVTEGALSSFLSRMGGTPNAHFFTVQRSEAPVTRIRALVALVRALAPTTGSASLRLVHSTRLVPDCTSVPLWARPFVAIAVRKGYWSFAAELHPTRSADWGFLRLLISNALGGGASLPNARPNRHTDREVDREDRGYSGLVVDAHDLPVQRSMSTRVLDEDGRLIYPTPDHMPDPDMVDDAGTVSYYQSGRDPSRAGGNPYFVRALQVQGDDLIISNEAAERILNENRRSHFLWRWHVCVLVDEGQ